jgi:polysaccharide biosynthesis protein PelC
MNRFLRHCALPVLGCVILGACSTVNAPPAPSLESGARWSVLAMRNDTETPLAGNRAIAIVDSVLRAQGISNLVVAPAAVRGDVLTDASDEQSLTKALAWARNEKIRYGIAGTVTEWRYKVGVDGEPAVGLTLQLLDIESGKVLWSASGGRSGFSRESLAGVAQELVQKLSQPLASAR